MNARSVPNSAGLRLGLSLTAILLIGSARAEEITITVTGTLNGGRDMFGIFAMPGNIMDAGTPYTLTFTFDDSKGQALKGGPCTGTGIFGTGQNSPGTAVLTINGKSYEFGRKPDAVSRIWRALPSSCSDCELGFLVKEGPESLMSGVNIKVSANRGQKALTGERDWRSDVSLSNFEARNTYNAFAIRRPGNYSAQTMSYLSVSTVTVTRAKTGKTVR